MDKINWGIIGCGDVAEVKSGPAFNKVEDSSLVAVMRRNAEKAKDYASRHHVSKWYADAMELINDPEVNAIYIATPPSSHREYTLAAIEAGKPVYVEKPMSTNARYAQEMAQAAKAKNIKLVVAHYRRAQPLFQTVKQLIDEKIIGNTLYVRLSLFKKPLTEAELESPQKKWRVTPSISGGGLFHDLAPHQLDIMYYFFGPAIRVSGVAANRSMVYDADDIVSGNILFENKTIFSGLWSFRSLATEEQDHCEIVGDEGKIIFSFFDNKPIEILKQEGSRRIHFDPHPHVQLPMIKNTVNYFLGRGSNPCSGEEGVTIMQWMDQIAAIK